MNLFAREPRFARTMRRHRLAILFVLLAGGLGGITPGVSAPPRTTIIVENPQDRQLLEQHLGLPVEPSLPHQVGPKQAYPYGWFGAPRRQHWSRHFGYYRNYTEWSAR